MYYITGTTLWNRSSYSLILHTNMKEKNVWSYLAFTLIVRKKESIQFLNLCRLVWQLKVHNHETGLAVKLEIVFFSRTGSLYDLENKNKKQNDSFFNDRFWIESFFKIQNEAVVFNFLRSLTIINDLLCINYPVFFLNIDLILLPTRYFGFKLSSYYNWNSTFIA